MDALLGLACSPSSPWALPEGASAEDRFLKELAIRKPWQIKDSFFYSYFTSLRVVDKKAGARGESVSLTLGHPTQGGWEGGRERPDLSGGRLGPPPTAEPSCPGPL